MKGKRHILLMTTIIITIIVLMGIIICYTYCGFPRRISNIQLNLSDYTAEEVVKESEKILEKMYPDQKPVLTSIDIYYENQFATAKFIIEKKLLRKKIDSIIIINIELEGGKASAREYGEVQKLLAWKTDYDQWKIDSSTAMKIAIDYLPVEEKQCTLRSIRGYNIREKEARWKVGITVAGSQYVIDVDPNSGEIVDISEKVDYIQKGNSEKKKFS